MDGLFHGKPYEQMDDLVGFPPIFGNTHMECFGPRNAPRQFLQKPRHMSGKAIKGLVPQAPNFIQSFGAVPYFKKKPQAKDTRPKKA